MEIHWQYGERHYRRRVDEYWCRRVGDTGSVQLNFRTMCRRREGDGRFELICREVEDAMMVMTDW